MLPTTAKDGSVLKVGFNMGKIHLFDKDTEEVIRCKEVLEWVPQGATFLSLVEIVGVFGRNYIGPLAGGIVKPRAKCNGARSRTRWRFSATSLTYVSLIVIAQDLISVNLSMKEVYPRATEVK